MSSSTETGPAADITALPRHRAAPGDRTGAIWLGSWVAALLLLVLIIFMWQNTVPVEVSFLAWQATVPLALVLLTAAVGTAILTLAVGTARIARLRRLHRSR
ncbi:LapA family protein [Catenuloplanes indicus]|uniref:Integral membrane protein n=1 Tax=Catenuloplanes indicus TaxID=137267 RepID=A0AAE3W023_9ACTN|nr:lipopolysaccharide assembly protein LapA domain-containing protein [Catenuloplanes indicus]MDQ0366830.1 putative integral membrane protein [Catenuloplanes indicus]